MEKKMTQHKVVAEDSLSAMDEISSGGGRARKEFEHGVRSPPSPQLTGSQRRIFFV